MQEPKPWWLGFTIGTALAAACLAAGGCSSPGHSANNDPAQSAVAAPRLSASPGPATTMTTEAEITIPPTTAPDVTVTDCVGDSAQVRPSTLTLACATGGVLVTGVSWLSWGGSTASGMGQLGESSCATALKACSHRKMELEPASVVLGDLTLTGLGGSYRSVSVKPLPPNSIHFTADTGRLPG